MQSPPYIIYQDTPLTLGEMYHILKTVFRPPHVAPALHKHVPAQLD